MIPPVRILQLMGHGSVGGTETFVISLVQGLIERGHDVTLANSWTDSPFNHLAQSSDVPFVLLPGGARRMRPRWFRMVGAFLLRNRFDIVQTYGLRVSLGVRLMQPFLSLRHHLTGVRGLDQQRTGLQAKLDRRTEGFLDCIVCNAQAVADRRMEYVGTPGKRIRIIPNGIDMSQFHPNLPTPSRNELNLPDGFLIANVASFRIEKDHENLLDAFKRAGTALRDAKIVLIGTGEREPLIREKIRALQLENRVVLAGPVKDVRPMLKACDAFVLSSFSEGMPRAFMEALAVGVPSVATTAGGVSEVAENERDALLVPTRDADALSKALVRIVSDTALRERLAIAGPQRIRDAFSRSSMLDRHIELYQSIIDGNFAK